MPRFINNPEDMAALTDWERELLAMAARDADMGFPAGDGQIPNLAMVSLRMDCLRLAIKHLRRHQAPTASSVEFWALALVGAAAFARFVLDESPRETDQ